MSPTDRSPFFLFTIQVVAMFGDILFFLLNTTFTLFGAALVARAWMHAVRMPTHPPLVRVLYQTTHWLVTPLRRLIPSSKTVDWATLAAAWLCALVYLILIKAIILGMFMSFAELPMALGFSFLTVLKWLLNLMVWVTLAQAILSWINPTAPLMPVLQMLTNPLLNPIRQVLPRSGIDFSPLVLLVVTQVALIIITRLTDIAFSF
jgi:YggT family protein